MIVKKAIVSGAAGFIGNAVVRQLISHGIDTTAVVKPGIYQSEEAFRLKGLDIPVIECDLKAMEKLPEMIRDRGYDVFYQFAWDGVDKEAFLDYERQIANITWTLKSVETAALLGCGKFIGAGSVTQLELEYPEGRAFTSDRHKYFRAAQMAGEVMGRALAREKHMEFIWPVIINVYGEGETAPRLINSTIRNLLAGRHQSFSKGEQLYDFLHIEDAARAFYLIGENGHEGSRYIVGSGAARPLREYLEVIRDTVAPEMNLGLGELEFHGLEMTEDMLNTEALVKDTGFMPGISFVAGIRRTLAWIREKDG